MNQSYVDLPINLVKEECIRHLININNNPDKSYLSTVNKTKIKHLSHICNIMMQYRYMDVQQIIHLSIEDFILLWPIPSEEWAAKEKLGIKP